MNVMCKVLGYWLKIILEAFVVFLLAHAAFALPFEEVLPKTSVNTNLIGAAVGENLVLTNGVLSATDGGGITEEHDPVWESDKSGVYTAIGAKVNKAANPTGGNFAALSADGGIADSGKKPGDFLKTHFIEGPTEPRIEAVVIDPSMAEIFPFDLFAVSLQNRYIFEIIANGRAYYNPEGTDVNDPAQELAVKGDLADKADTAYVDARDLDGTYPVTSIASAIVNHRRNILDVADGQTVTIAALAPLPTDFDATLRLSLGTGAAVNWAVATNGLSVFSPKGNKALEFEAGKSYILGITASGASRIDISKQELEAL